MPPPTPRGVWKRSCGGDGGGHLREGGDFLELLRVVAGEVIYSPQQDAHLSRLGAAFDGAHPAEAGIGLFGDVNPGERHVLAHFGLGFLHWPAPSVCSLAFSFCHLSTISFLGIYYEFTKCQPEIWC